MHRSFACALLATLALALPTLPAAAQNLIPNGRFDTNLDGWTNVEPSKFWTSDDADNNPNSGSATIVNNLDVGGGPFIEVCVPIQPGAHYLYGGDVKIVSSLLDSGRGRLELAFWPQLGCTGGGALGGILITTQQGSWIPLLGGADAPGNALSASLMIEVDKLLVVSTNNLGARFDNVLLVVPEPKATETALAALAPLGALVLRRRRSR